MVVLIQHRDLSARDADVWQFIALVHLRSGRGACLIVGLYVAYEGRMSTNSWQSQIFSPATSYLAQNLFQSLRLSQMLIDL